MQELGFSREIDRRVTMLFSPIRIGSIDLRNRIVSTAHSTGLSDEGLIGDAATAYYEARAAGGTGLIITGSTSVHPSSSSKFKPALINWSDDVIAPYRRLAAAVHRHGARLIVQLNHAGGLSGHGGPFGCVVGPSPYDHELGVEPAREISISEIDVVVSAFAAAARRVRDAGLDGVEIHGGHGNLIQQFLSPATNVRSDQYGASPQNRLHFADQVVRAVRDAVGENFVVGLRLCAEEDYQDGLTIQDTPAIARALVSAGRLSYVNVTSGSDTSSRSLPRHYAPMSVRSGHMRRLMRPIRDAVGVPVIGVGRFTDPLDAEAALQAGDADLIGMTRALIADAELPRKARAGAFSSIRYCVGANEGCLGRLFRGHSITCIQNPASGREHLMPPLAGSARKRRVVVVGGGVAGLEAARVAAVRGHSVVLLEREPDVGGQLSLARQVHGREEIGAVADNLERACRNAGVDIRTGVAANTGLILELSPDAVVLATGSAAFVPTVLDDGNERLVSARDVLAGATIGDPAVVYDTKGDYVGVTTAIYLARRRHRVTLITTLRSLAPAIEPMTLRVLEEQIASAGISVLPLTQVEALVETGIVLRDLVTNETRLLPDIATVVAATGSAPIKTLEASLAAANASLPVHVIGDAVSLGQIEGAIADGHRVGREL